MGATQNETTPNADADTQFDAGTLTDAEQAIIDEAAGNLADDTDAASTDAADALAAADAQAALDAQAVIDAQAAADAAQAALPAEPGEAPEAPEDFEQARLTADERFRTGLDDAVDVNREYLRILRAEEAHARTLDAHKASIAAFEDAKQNAAKAGVDAWTVDYNAWAGNHRAFMGNVLCKADMQLAINAIETANPGISNSELLEKAYDQVAAVRTVPKEVDPESAAVAAALSGRKQERVATNLGDVPAARGESIERNSDYAALDQLPITDLEDQVAGMSDAQREKFLRDAPGADATGRD